MVIFHSYVTVYQKVYDSYDRPKMPIFKEPFHHFSVFVPTFLDVKNLGALACAILTTTILGFGWFWIIPSSLSDADGGPGVTPHVGLRYGEIET